MLESKRSCRRCTYSRGSHEFNDNEMEALWRLPILAIHSCNNQVAPIGPTETRIAELQKSGVNAKLIALTGITHFETHRFADGLRQAVPWLRDIWK
jgi:fermentation-respiration switch protein FrsA (DUF1100 family)